MLPAPATSHPEWQQRPQLNHLLSTARNSLAILSNNRPSTPKVGDKDRSHKRTHSALLPSPKTSAFIISCLLWYLSSALSSNTSKALLSAPKHTDAARVPPFPYPVTLTLLQFVFIHILSSAVASPAVMRHVPGMKKPVTRIVSNPGWKRILDMAKLSVFNVIGHALSTVAISRVPVSTVHTIKALTPLFTVLSFRFLFHVHYSFMAYLSLFPLTLGVMMACTSLSFSANDLVGLVAALASTLIFVAQSIYSKNLIGRGGKEAKDGASQQGKLDKINILYFTSACSIMIMIPMALFYDGRRLFSAVSVPSTASNTWISSMIIANGVVQFLQNFLAFSVIAIVSPVTYSIASLFKRVFVICFAIIWFGQKVSALQWSGILLTFVGLYIYNHAKTSKSIAQGEEKLAQEERQNSMSLPTTNNTYLSPTKSHSTGASTSIVQSAYNAYHNNVAPNVASWTLGSQGSRNNPSYLQDPRQSIPSPPPSRGPSSDDEGHHKIHLSHLQ